MKAKLGISVGLLGAAIYFAALFGGYTPVILLVGYVLLFEENEWLKRAAVKAAVLMVSITFILAVIGLIPDLLSWVNSLVAVFKGSFNYGVLSAIISVITKAIDIIRTCLFLLLGMKALNQGTVAVPVVDQIVNKYF
ncbi:MAG: hypothetical protein J6J79_01830 [Lachnospiraceae bacterium]|nr:hypothetical protein [Lachnospiraceae bacterium]